MNLPALAPQQSLPEDFEGKLFAFIDGFEEFNNESERTLGMFRDGFYEFMQEFMLLVTKAEDLNRTRQETIRDKLLGQTLDNVIDFTSQVGDLNQSISELFSGIQGNLGTVSGKIDGQYKSTLRMDRLLLQLDTICSTLSIVNSTLDSSNANLDAFVQEFRDLSSSIRQMMEDYSNQLLAAKASLDKGQGKMDGAMEAIAQIGENVSEVLPEVQGALLNVSESIIEVLQESRDTASDLRRGTQFVVFYVEAALLLAEVSKEARNAFQEIRSRPYTREEIEGLIAEQVSNLSSAMNDVILAYAPMWEFCDAAKDMVTRLSKTFSYIASDTEGTQQIQNLFSQLRERFGHIHSLKSLIDTVGDLPSELEPVSRNVAGMEGFVTDIEVANNSIRLLAANATIQASKLGESGDVIKVLCQGIQDIYTKFSIFAQDIQKATDNISSGIHVGEGSEWEGALGSMGMAAEGFSALGEDVQATEVDIQRMGNEFGGFEQNLAKMGPGFSECMTHIKSFVPKLQKQCFALIDLGKGIRVNFIIS